MSFWKKVSSTRGDAGVREALGAVHAIAEEGLRPRANYTDQYDGASAALRKILDVIQAEMLPKERPSKPPILSPVAYAGCQSGVCKKPEEVRGLYEVAGRNVCISCRKRAQKWLAETFSEWWTTPLSNQAAVWNQLQKERK